MRHYTKHPAVAGSEIRGEYSGYYAASPDIDTYRPLTMLDATVYADSWNIHPSINRSIAFYSWNIYPNEARDMLATIQECEKCT
jgi:hypothetical protein